MTSQAIEEKLAAARGRLAAPWEESEERVVDVGEFPIVVRKRVHRYYLETAASP